MKKICCHLVGMLVAVGALAQSGSPFAVSASLTNAGASTVLAVSFRMPERHYLYANQMVVEAPSGIGLLRKSIPTPHEKQDPFTNEKVGVYDRDTTLTYEVEGPVGDALALEVGYQGCSESVCFLPARVSITASRSIISQAREDAGLDELEPGRRPPGQTGLKAGRLQSSPRIPGATVPTATVGSFRAVARASGYLRAAAFIEFLDRAESGRGAEPDRLAKVFRAGGLWLVMALILVGGLALNLTPCVLPMIPINVAIIGAGAQACLPSPPTGGSGKAGSRLRGFLLGGLYGIGMALVYGVLGLVVILTGARFGSLNASPWFNLGIAALFLWLSLAMFGMFSVDLSRFQGKVGDAGLKRGGGVAAFAMGGIAALLAGACVAPVVISVLLLSSNLYADGKLAGLFFPFLLGAGMGLPWPLVGAGLSFLPKPGKWMTWVKHAFGAIILALALWYGFLGYRLARERSPASRAVVVAAQSAQMDTGWMTSLDEALKLAQDSGKPVFVDFWASWCKSCLEMDRTTFRDGGVRRRLDRYVRVKYQAEDLRDPAVKALLDRFEVVGLPTYLVLNHRR